MRLFTSTILSAAILATSVPAFAAEATILKYDAANRLRKVERGDLKITYMYDGLGNLDAEIVDDGATVVRTDLMVDEQGPYPRVVGALGNDGNRELYAYGPTGVAMVRKANPNTPGVAFRALTDELGTVRGLANAAGGALVGRVAHDPWGRTRAAEGIQTRLGFAGELTDRAGFLWLRARHYAPLLGRFLQRDTIVGDTENPQALNRYAYAANNPLANVDPSGNEPITGTVLAVVAVVGFVASTLHLLLGPMATGANTPTGPLDPSLARVAEDDRNMGNRVAKAMLDEFIWGMTGYGVIHAVAPVFKRVALALRQGKHLGTMGGAGWRSIIMGQPTLDDFAGFDGSVSYFAGLGRLSKAGGGGAGGNQVDELFVERALEHISNGGDVTVKNLDTLRAHNLRASEKLALRPGGGGLQIHPRNTDEIGTFRTEGAHEFDWQSLETGVKPPKNPNELHNEFLHTNYTLRGRVVNGEVSRIKCAACVTGSNSLQ